MLSLYRIAGYDRGIVVRAEAGLPNPSETAQLGRGQGRESRSREPRASRRREPGALRPR